jgi:hypothetical protein
MTYCSKRIKWGQETGCEPSSFIGELDDEHIQFTTYDEILGAEPSSEELDDFFGSFKDMLNKL